MDRPGSSARIAREAPPLERLPITPQPDDVSCGPACLHAIYRHYGHERPLPRLMEEVPKLDNGGRLAVQLGVHALEHGFRARLYTYNLEIFDPTWFGLAPEDLAGKLRAQRRVKPSKRLHDATAAYLRFLELGGQVEHEMLSAGLLARHLDSGHLLLAGVCATYLYGCRREIGDLTLVYDDVRGHPQGHFVVLYGHDPGQGTMHVADPLAENPRFGAGSHHYVVRMERVIGAILLGAFTWDANFLILEPAEEPAG